MINLLPRLESEFPWPHTRSAREKDCHDFCERLGVHVVFQHGVPFGVYVLSEGKHFIFLDPKLTGWMLLYVFCHEIGHYLFHSPTQSNEASPPLVLEFFTQERHRKNDIEAEQVAALMLFPMHEIPEIWASDAHLVYPELEKLIEVREKLDKFIRERDL